MNIGIAFDLKEDYLKMGFSEEECAEFDKEETIQALEESIKSLGHNVVRIGNIYELIKRLSLNEKWDLVFNISEGLYGRSREAQIPAILEAYKINYTFSDPLTLALCLDKAMTKKIVRDAGVLTSEFFEVSSVKDIEKSLPNKKMVFPLFVKPLAEGTSKGISSKSIVHNITELKTQCKKIISKFNQPVIVEKYLSGREFTAGVLGTGKDAKVIGVIEINLKKKAEPLIYSYSNKEFFETRIEYTLVKEKKIIKEISDMVLKSYNILKCRDAARVDFRADDKGKLYFLEINPLAGLNPKRSDLPIICKKVGISYEELIKQILESSLKNKKNNS